MLYGKQCKSVNHFTYTLIIEQIEIQSQLVMFFRGGAKLFVRGSIATKT